MFTEKEKKTGFLDEMLFVWPYSQLYLHSTLCSLCPVLQPCLSSHTDASVLPLERAFQPAVCRPPAKGYLLTQRDAEKHQRLAQHEPELGRCERLSAKKSDICGQETLQKQAGVKGLKTSDLPYTVFHHVNITRSPIPLFNFFHVWWLECDPNARGWSSNKKPNQKLIYRFITNI